MVVYRGETEVALVTRPAVRLEETGMVRHRVSDTIAATDPSRVPRFQTREVVNAVSVVAPLGPTREID